MDLIVLDTSLNPLKIIDTYESLIWTDRYWEHGDFELYTSMTDSILGYIRQDYYLAARDSEHVMIVEKILIKSDAEDGDHLTVSGRSLESILNRRIVWGRKIISGNLQNGIKTLLEEAIISPSDIDRKIDNFIFEESDDPLVTELTVVAQYTGDNLYDVIHKICSNCGIGFRITINDHRQFVFKLYSGVDRSYDQINNPYVVFSPNFENIINSNYMESKSALKNVALIGGEGEGTARKFASVGDGKGLSRREIFVDARDISSDVGDGVTLTESEYSAQLEQRGDETLAENTDVESFEGEVETNIMYRYGEDFFNGDIIQIADAYGHESKARILEIVMSKDETGTSVYPTFKTI